MVIDSDLYKPYHPSYRELLSTVMTVAPPARLGRAPDGQRWMNAAERYVLERHLNAIVATTAGARLAYPPKRC